MQGKICRLRLSQGHEQLQSYFGLHLVFLGGSNGGGFWSFFFPFYLRERDIVNGTDQSGNTHMYESSDGKEGFKLAEKKGKVI